MYLILLIIVFVRLSAAWQLDNDFTIDFNSPFDLDLFNQETRDTVGNGWGNNEKQTYTGSNAAISNGFLNIKTERTKDGAYLSARLRSKFGIRYGVIEMRAKLPRGVGTWPAFWLLPAKPKFKWPMDGEIDIMEHVGFMQGQVHAAIHTNKNNHIIDTQIVREIKIDTVSDEFHVYKLNWSPDRLIISIDNNDYFTYDKELNADYNSWPFDNYFNVMLNTAVGGNWAGQKEIDDSVFPQTYSIDYVKYTAYKRDNLLSNIKWSQDPSTNSRWSMGCDWTGNDMGSVQEKGELCALKCRAALKCTHFTWTNYNSGTCWLKSSQDFEPSLLTKVPSSQVCGYML